MASSSPPIPKISPHNTTVNNVMIGGTRTASL